MPAKRIIIVDQDPSARAYVADLLRYFGYRTDIAGSLLGTIHCLNSSEYDAVLLDDFMSGVQRSSVLEWLREHSRAAPVVIMSDMTQFDLMVDRGERGAADVINKPIQPSQLKRALGLNVQGGVSSGYQ